MTKTPAAAAAPCAGVDAMLQGLNRPAAPADPSPHALSSLPELRVTCELCMTAQTQHRPPQSTGLSCASQPDEESLCSDSGCSCSPASTHPDCSSRSSLGLSQASSFEEYEEDPNPAPPSSAVSENLHTDRNMVNWSPVVVPLKNRAPWVQVVGHAGNFQTDSDGKLLKKYCEGEEQCLQQLMGDVLKPFVPTFYGKVQQDEQEYNAMEDLLAYFEFPCIMDCKMGRRTYLEEELTKARKNPQPREDLYKKMVKVDLEAPTPEEKAQQAVLKTRYMQWRETLSSTATLGFRIEGIKKSDGSCNTNFKRTKSTEEVMSVLRDFVDQSASVLKNYLERLKELRGVLEKSDFFRTHEVVGSSLLFVHDQMGRVGVWMIDFGKTMPSPFTLDHRSLWEEGNREDGYLWGLDNLIDVLSNMLSAW